MEDLETAAQRSEEDWCHKYIRYWHIVGWNMHPSCKHANTSGYSACVASIMRLVVTVRLLGQQNDPTLLLPAALWA